MDNLIARDVHPETNEDRITRPAHPGYWELSCVSCGKFYITSKDRVEKDCGFQDSRHGPFIYRQEEYAG